MGKQTLTRKEKRKLERKSRKLKKSPKPSSKVNVSSTSRTLQKEERTNNNAIQDMKRKQIEKKAITHKNPTKSETEFEDPEDMDIIRLEKLLGVDRANKKKSAEKLNKEYEMYEGFTGGFGDFLMNLDELTNSVKKGNSKKSVSSIKNKLHESEDKLSMDRIHRMESSHQKDSGGNSEAYTYRPSAGEDIYGRVKDSGGKYVPPNRRLTQTANAMAMAMASTLEDNSEAVRLVRRLMNGQMNRFETTLPYTTPRTTTILQTLPRVLSDQTKDNVVRTVKGIFDSNSLTIASLVLKDCILAACANQTQIMTTLIPIYAAIVAALHFAIGIDVGAFIVESLATKLHEAMKERSEATQKDVQHELISNKVAGNALLLLVYLYNLRVLHHSLIIDVLNLLVGLHGNGSRIGEMEAELVVAVVEHCGPQLRCDDPVGLKVIISNVSKQSQIYSNNSNEQQDCSSRVRFMLEAFTDLKNNKSRRTQSSNADVVRQLRKWLGSIKSSLGCKNGDLCLRVSLQDLLEAEKRGRWWRAGARWTGRDPANGDSSQTDNAEDGDENGNDRGGGAVNTNVSQEEQQLLLLATKLRMNTSVRRNIFMVVMSSRDVSDAFERLQRLQLKGKQDREIVRVVVECCGQERSYNAFYAELLSLFCNHNRQFKVTIQFVYWDIFTALDSDKAMKRADRRIVNQSRLLCHLICNFHVSMSVLKPVDMTNIGGEMVLFLATLFMGIFSFKISDDEFKKVLDRVATTSDYAAVRDNILLFLQHHLTSIPDGLDPEGTRLMRRRRKEAMKTMEAMNVLDMIREDE
eukprot:gene4653-9232_t